jgi:hypothetical protein
VKRCHNARADFSCHVCSRRAEEKKRDNELHDERGRRRRVRELYIRRQKRREGAEKCDNAGGG